jgi:RimJ/RimL family protein N-acetyltransferase
MKFHIPYEAMNDEMHKRRGMYYLPFVPEHFDHLDFDHKEISVLSHVYNIKSMISQQAQMGVAFTAFRHNRPIAVIGVVNIWPGVGELWSIFDNQARDIPATMLKSAIRFSDIAIRYLQLHRLQITVRTDDNRAFRYAKAIGFETESVMRKYGPDQIDYLLMARF